jgi:hypothetical protein
MSLRGKTRLPAPRTMSHLQHSSVNGALSPLWPITPQLPPGPTRDSAGYAARPRKPSQHRADQHRSKTRRTIGRAGVISVRRPI